MDQQDHPNDSVALESAHEPDVDLGRDDESEGVDSKKVSIVGRRDMEQIDKLRVFDKGVDHTKTNLSLISSLVLRVGGVHVPYVENIEPLKAECAHFVSSVENNTEPRSNGEKGVEVLRILEAASKSLELGGKNIRL